MELLLVQYIGKYIYETPCFPDCAADLPVSERVVVYLAQNLLDKGDVYKRQSLVQIAR